MLERRETAGLGVEMRKIEAPAELLLAAVLAHEAVQPALKTACQPEIVTVDGEDQSVVEDRSEEHTSELQSLMRISYAVFCLKKKKNIQLMQTYDNTPTPLFNNTT